MNLSNEAIRDWIDRLKVDPAATAVAQPPTYPMSPFKEPATWRVSVFASAMLYTPTQKDVERVIDAIPKLYEEFESLMGAPLARTQLDSGKVAATTAKRLDEIRRAFDQQRKDVDLETVNDYSGENRESSPVFAFEADCSFEPSSQPGGKLQMLSFVNVRLPVSHWLAHREAFDRWWRKAITLLAPEQAYMGLAFANPPILARYPFVEPAEFALANAFYGLDVDKPFFMRGSPMTKMTYYLEHGMRTPAFGAYVGPKYLPIVGGEAALRTALAADPRVTIEPIGEGLWLQAGDVPELYPFEQGIPRHVALLARALKPARLDALWLLSYVPALPREDTFDYETGRQWLRRFDDDGTWPDPKLRFEQPLPSQAVPRPDDPTLRCPAGEPCPRDGYWTTPAKTSSRRRFERGEVMPEVVSDYGATIWVWDGAD
jgi:Protein of unknown function (DUF3396)